MNWIEFKVNLSQLYYNNNNKLKVITFRKSSMNNKFKSYRRRLQI
mgnify:CR=1 FL=1